MYSSVTSSFMAGHRPDAGIFRYRVLYFDYGNPTCYPGTGSAVNDLTQNNNDGTLVGAVTYENVSTPSGTVPAIKYAGGVTTIPSVPDFNMNADNNLTVMAWIKLPPLSGGMNIFNKVQSGAASYKLENNVFAIVFPPNPPVYTITTFTTTIATTSKSGQTLNALPIDTWCMLTITPTISGTTATITYVNDTQANSYTHGAEPLVNNTVPLSFGGTISNPSYYIHMAEQQVFNKRLTPSEVSILYNLTKSRYL